MYDTVVTVVGNVATGVEFRDTPGGGVARFRLAASVRRWDRQNEVWVDGPTSFYTVWARRSLGANLAASVSVGEPLVVHGRLRVREEEWEGQRRTSVDIDAVAAGHDLTRGTSAFRRVVKATPFLTEPRAGARSAARAEPRTDGPAPSGAPRGAPPKVPPAAPRGAPLAAPPAAPVEAPPGHGTAASTALP
ncbi:single-stranded DNA-binding protein [Streptomyces sp. NPDC088725]|uniref:single-stranded DNA-binding protein n=1 Tax=Streptomyces sp. NPDC088725 TaxID=3365873 RepID=UPI0038009EE3